MAPDERDLDVVDPDIVGAVRLDGISAPDVLGVKLGDVDVSAALLENGGMEGKGCNILNDDILDTALHDKTFPSNHTRGANTNNRLVGAEDDAAGACFIVGHLDCWKTVTPKHL